jgi:CDP-diacylglycerol--glycerol-3-phosphate 3-phosphatidyltransferase
MAVVVVARELLVTALRSFLEERGADFSATQAGKLKMALQCLAVVASLCLLGGLRTATVPPAWLPGSVTVLVWLALVATVYSGIGYVISAARLLGAAR